MYNSQTGNLPADPPGESTPYTAQEVDDPTSLTYWPHPRPEGVRALPLFLYNRFQKEVVITELGYHVPRHVESTFEQAVKDDLRVQYWQEIVPNVLALVTEDRVPLTAVLAWSLIDNYEFETYEFRWGHIAVDCEFAFASFPFLIDSFPLSDWDPVTKKVNTDKGSRVSLLQQQACERVRFAFD
ncbi:glycoside hydrolase superfamily [Chytriomyces sp. MP71]|nr:glycoside hydrolase superfamily [Chytriomyces sp. MP71]